jgi:hypothetical protein
MGQTGAEISAQATAQAAGSSIATTLATAAVVDNEVATGAAATDAAATGTATTGAAVAPATTTAAAPPIYRYTFEDGEAAGWNGDPADWAVIPDETGSNFIYQGTAPPDSFTATELPAKVEMSTWRNYAVHMRLRAHQEGSNPDLTEFWLTTRAPLENAVGCSYYNTFFDFGDGSVTQAKGGDASCEYVQIADGSYPPLEAGSKWYSDVQQGYVFFNVGDGAIVQFDDVEVYRLDE